MMGEHINTARLNDLTEIESLNQDQLAAVVKIRKFAEAQKTSPYTLGVLDTRNVALLGRLQTGRRFAKLSPASREILIAELREAVHPYSPTVVAVYSAWCEANAVDPDPQTPYEQAVQDNAIAIAGAFPATEEETAHAAQNREAIARAREHRTARRARLAQEGVAHAVQKNGARHYDRNAGAKIDEMLHRVLADGEFHSVKQLQAEAKMLGFVWGTVAYRAKRIGVEFGGRALGWRLPKPKRELVEGIVVGHDEPTKAVAKPTVVKKPAKQPREPQVRRKGARTPQSHERDERTVQRIERIARRYGCSPSTLVRWTECQKAPGSKNLYGVRSGLPDRDSDEGLELADEVFQMCHPSAPWSLVEIVRQRRQRVSA